MLILANDVREAQDIAQRYKVEISITQEFTDSDDMRLPYFIRQIGHIGQVLVKIEYTDYAVAQSIDACISGWIDTLKENKPHWLARYLFSAEYVAESFLDTAARATPMLAGALYIASNLGKISAQEAVALSLFCLALGFVSFTVVSRLTSAFYGLLRRFAPSTIIQITRGDRDKLAHLAKRRNDAKWLMSVVVISIVLSFVVNIYSAFVYDIIK